VLHFTAPMLGWLSYVAAALITGCLLYSVILWGRLVLEAWEEKRVWAVFLVVFPVVAIAATWFVSPAFAFLILLGLVVIFAHRVMTLWMGSHRPKAAILAGGFGLSLLLVTSVLLVPGPPGIGEPGGIARPLGIERPPNIGTPGFAPMSPYVPDIIKQDCQHLVEGQLVFAPLATMRQGEGCLVSARLGRGTDTNIRSGLDGGTFIIENTKVSCMVSMTLDSQEASAFKIENSPTGRPDEQFLLPNQFAEWNWHVTPLKHGVLHLLLYVTPVLYVDGIGRGLKLIPQPPRVIKVTPDYLYQFWSVVSANWAVSGTVFTAVIIPLVIWLTTRFKRRRDANRRRRPAGFV
jgi:hypothetical protein